MDFQSTSLKECCPTINSSFKIKYLDNTRLIDILVISFHGKYRDGSEGGFDARFIKGTTNLGVSLFKPTSLVIDFSDLEYNWGDDFDLSFEEIKYCKVVVLVGEKCRKGMSTLSFGLDSKKDIVDNELFFDNLEKAIERL